MFSDEKEFAALVVGLRAWAADQGPHVRAAVELLAWHKHWLHRAAFHKACVKHFTEDGSYGIIWPAARRFAGTAPRASSSEAGVLDLAVALGEDAFGFSGFGHAHKRAVAEAFAETLGQELAPAVPRHAHPDFIPCEAPCPLAVSND